MNHFRARFALCALLLTAPLATVAAGGMMDAGDFYASLNYDVAFPGERGITTGEGNDLREVNLETGIGFLGAQLGVGYAISGFRPELYAAYRRAPIAGATLKKSGTSNVLDTAQVNMDLDNFNEWTGSTVSVLDLGFGVHYDIDTGTPIVPYLGVAGAASNLSLALGDEALDDLTDDDVGLADLAKTDSAWAFGFQGSAGLGYAVSDDLIISLGYRLTGATDAELTTSKAKMKLALGHNGVLGLRYNF